MRKESASGMQDVAPAEVAQFSDKKLLRVSLEHLGELYKM